MKSTFKPEVKKPNIKLGGTARVLLLYFVGSVAAFTGLTFLAQAIGGGNSLFVVLLCGLFLLGVFHVWLMTKFFEWDKPFLHKSIFTVVVMVIGIGIIFFLLKSSEAGQFGDLASLSALAFSLPHFYKMAIDQIISIPEKIYRTYAIDTFEDVDRAAISFEENERGLIWQFDVENSDSNDLSLPVEPVRMFAPKKVMHMPFKKLFKASMLFHNVRLNPDHPIQVFEETTSGERIPFEWYFRHRPYPFLGLRYIDPDKSIAQNGIRFTKRKTNYGKEILAPEIFVIRQSNQEISGESDVSNKSEHITEANSRIQF